MTFSPSALLSLMLPCRWPITSKYLVFPWALWRYDDLRCLGQRRRLADTMLSLDDLSEDGLRVKMEAWALADDRLMPLRSFEKREAKLSDILGAQFSELLEGIAVRLGRRGWERINLTDLPTC